jgi:multiple sugar transport system substrate-binding protein
VSDNKTKLAGVLAAAALLATACGGGSASEGGDAAEAGSGTGTIQIWAQQGQEKEVAAIQETVAKFNSSQSDVKADLRLIPEADYNNSVNAAKVEDLPDVLMVDGPNTASMVYNRKLSPIDEFISPATKANATAPILQQGTIDGKLYVLGQFESGLGIWGNKKLLDAAGVKYPTGLSDAWTAKEFGEALAALAAKDDDGKVLDVKENYTFTGEWTTYGFSPLLYSAGAGLIKDGKAAGTLDSPQAVQAMETFVSWKKYIDPNTNDDAFTKGKVALSWVGHWTYPDYREALGDDLVLLPLPDFGNGVKTGHGSWTWGISATSKNAKAAGTFLDTLLADEAVKAMTAANGAVPGTTSVLEASEPYQEGGPLRLYYEQLSKPCGDAADASCAVVTRPLTAGYPVITNQFAGAFKAIYEGADAKAQLEKAAKAIDTDFADNGGYAIE